jgi:hypothetical protein
VSLHSYVGDELSGRVNIRRAAASAVARQPRAPFSVRLSGASMRILETGLALTAIATAVLIGLGR